MLPWDDFAQPIWLTLLCDICLSLCLLSVLFQGDIQQLLILEDPQAAASYCVNYIPDCDSALPYNSQSLGLQEVSSATDRKQLQREKPMQMFVEVLNSWYDGV